MTIRNWLLTALFAIGFIVKVIQLFRKEKINTEKDPELAKKYIALNHRHNVILAWLFVVLIILEIDPLFNPD
ncbi:MAG: hypothetical protein NC453_06020 [Muribaculum sp.]|nr:hypothetical protein [Muribaculum sp.]